MTALWSLLMDGLIQRYRKTVEHVHFVLQTERSGNLLTTNHYFSETLDKLRSDRSAEQIAAQNRSQRRTERWLPLRSDYEPRLQTALLRRNYIRRRPATPARVVLTLFNIGQEGVSVRDLIALSEVLDHMNITLFKTSKAHLQTSNSLIRARQPRGILLLFGESQIIVVE